MAGKSTKVGTLPNAPPMSTAQLWLGAGLVRSIVGSHPTSWCNTEGFVFISNSKHFTNPGAPFGFPEQKNQYPQKTLRGGFLGEEAGRTSLEHLCHPLACTETGKDTLFNSIPLAFAKVLKWPINFRALSVDLQN